MKHQVYLSLGSNLDDRKSLLQLAVNQIFQKLGWISRISPIYETPAWGFSGNPFYNIVIAVQTNFNPKSLLAEIHHIEKNLGRHREFNTGYANRTIDIDILFYDGEIIDDENLTIPHPKLHERRFVLQPLKDIAPNFIHPILNNTVDSLIQSCSDDSEIKWIGNLQNPNDKFQIAKVDFIAIEGNIGSGKTSLTHLLSQCFQAKTILERFADNPFLPKFYEDAQRYAFPLEMSFLADRYAQLQDDLGQYDLFTHGIIADYYIYKSLIFAQVTLSEIEFNLYRNIFDVLLKDIRKPDLYIYLYQKTDHLLQNIKKRGRAYESRIQPEYLEKINQGYAQFIKTLPQERVLVIDVSTLDFVNNYADFLEILNQINTKIKEIILP